MDIFIQIAIILVIGLVLFFVARKSRVNFEKQNTDVKPISNSINLTIFLMWSVIWALVAIYFPLALLAVFALLYVGVLPIGLSRRSLMKVIIDNGFISVISIGIGTYFYVHVI